MNIHIVQSQAPFDAPYFEGAFSDFAEATEYALKAEQEHPGVDYLVHTVILDELLVKG